MTKSINQDKLLTLIESGETREQCAKNLGVSIPTLSRRLSDLRAKQGLLLEYRNIQALHLTELQARVLEAITPEKIEEAPLRDLVICYKILKERELVSEGKPSEMTGLVSYLVQLEKEQVSADCQVVITQQEPESITTDMPKL